MALATAFAGFGGPNILIWVANGLMLSYLLLVPRWHWPAYLCVGFAAQVAGSQLAGIQVAYPHLGLSVLNSVLNVAEVFISAQLLRRRTNQLPHFTKLAYLLRFFLIAVLGAPLAVGTIYALIDAFWLHASTSPLLALVRWAVFDGLGAAVTTPALVAIFITRFRSSVNWKLNWPYPALFVAVTIAGFAQFKIPVLFFVYPLLILVLMRLGLAWAATLTLFMAGVGSWCTAHGMGPFASTSSFFLFESSVLLQAYIAFGMFMVYTVSVVLETQKITERRLQEIAALHSLVTENSRDAIIIADLHGMPSYISPAMERMAGWSPEEMTLHGGPGVIHPDDLARVKQLASSIRASVDGAMTEYRVRKRNGEYLLVEASIRALVDTKSGAPTGTLSIIRDITERKLAEQSREFQHSLIRAIQEVSLDGILVVDGNDNAVSYNRKFSDVWKIFAPDIPDSLHGKAIFVPDDQLLSQVIDRVKDPEAFLKRVQELYADPSVDDQCEIELKDGRTLERYSSGLLSDTGQGLGRVWFFRDITDRKLAEQQLRDAYNTFEVLAVIDSLTGLANRRRFDECLSMEWRRAIRENKPLSLLLLDVDHFKSYNDTYGHLRGDSCLRQIAECAQGAVTRPGDLVARFGGDEFTIIMADTGNEGAMQVGNEVCERMRGCKLPHDANARGIVTVSIGCATIVPKLGQDPATLIDLADRTLYLAKHEGRDRVFSSSGNSEAAHDSKSNRILQSTLRGLA